MSRRTYRSAAPVAGDAAAMPGPRAPRDAESGSGPGDGRDRAAPGGPRRRKDPLWAKLLVIVGVLLMIGSGGAIVGGRVLLSQTTETVHRQNLLGEAGVPAGTAVSIDGAINLLLIGLDFRPNSREDMVRSDTIVILHIPASHDQAYLVSIPRDTRVDIPEYPKNNFVGASTKINAAFAFGHRGPGTEEEKRARGVELLAMTIRDLAGIRFNGAAIIDFNGFEAALRELGGVTIYVDQRAESIHLAENKDGKLQRVWYDDATGQVRDILPGYRPVVYEPGWHRLSAEKALDYSRIRKGLRNGDYDRQRHQQQLLKAMLKEATSKGMLTDLAKLMRVVRAAGEALTLDTQGVPLENLAFTLMGVTANEMALVKTNAGKLNPVPGSESDEQLTEESMQMLHAVRDGTLLEFLAEHPGYVIPAS